MIRKLTFIALALFALPALAVTVGELQPGGGTFASRGGTLAPLTIIGFSRPALESGTVDRATVMWTGAPAAGCANAFEIKFFRGTSSGPSVIAERGPFDAQQGINEVTLSPAVPVQAGDLLGITQLLPVSCGGVVNRRSDQHDAWGTVPTDPALGTTVDPDFTHGLVMSARASSEANPIHGYLTVAGSAPGSFGSSFKTAVTMVNRATSALTVTLLFHPAGTSDTAAGTFTTTLRPAESRTISDIVPMMAGATGVGSIDVRPISGPPPDVTARIYNDAGGAGTSGFTEELMTPYQAMYRLHRGSLSIPSDPANFRMNVGIRTLDDGATITVLQYAQTGELTGTVVARSYPSNFFEQLTASQFLNGAELSPGGYLVVQVEEGSAIVYATTTDNRTNDSSMRFPTKY